MGVQSSRFSAVALVAATAKTAVQLVAPADHRLRIVSWAFTTDGATAAGVPVLVDVLRQTTAGTASAGTVTAWDPADTSTIGTTQITFTAEPTAGDVLLSLYVPAYDGLYEREHDPLRGIIVPASGRLGIRATAPAGVNATGYIAWELA